MYEENYAKLANAVIVQAVKDFKPTYRRLKRFPNDKLARERVAEITEFFRLDYFSALSDLDGAELLKRIIREIDGKQGGDAQ